MGWLCETYGIHMNDGIFIKSSLKRLIVHFVFNSGKHCFTITKMEGYENSSAFAPGRQFL